MAISIKGIKITNFTINPTSTGKERITGDYSLMSNDDRVLAKQGFNGYNDIEVSFSAETVENFHKLLASLKKDIHTTLGITEE